MRLPLEMNLYDAVLPAFSAEETYAVPVCHRPTTALSFADFPAKAGRCGAVRAWPGAGGLIYMVQSVRGPGDFVKSILDAQGWSTSLFDDPASAWQAFVFAEPRPVLLVCDILDGLATTLELVRRCREIEPSLNTVLLGDCPVAELRADDMVAAGNMLSLHCCGPLLVQEVRRILAARRPRIPQPL